MTSDITGIECIWRLDHKQKPQSLFEYRRLLASLRSHASALEPLALERIQLAALERLAAVPPDARASADALGLLCALLDLIACAAPHPVPAASASSSAQHRVSDRIVALALGPLFSPPSSSSSTPPDAASAVSNAGAAGSSTSQSQSGGAHPDLRAVFERIARSSLSSASSSTSASTTCTWFLVLLLRFSPAALSRLDTLVQKLVGKPHISSPLGISELALVACFNSLLRLDALLLSSTLSLIKDIAISTFNPKRTNVSLDQLSTNSINNERLSCNDLRFYLMFALQEGILKQKFTDIMLKRLLKQLSRSTAIVIAWLCCALDAQLVPLVRAADPPAIATFQRLASLVIAQVRLRDTLVPLCATIEQLMQQRARPPPPFVPPASSLESIGPGHQQQQQQHSKRKRSRSRSQSQSGSHRSISHYFEDLEWADPGPGAYVCARSLERRGLPELELPYSVERVRFRRCVLALSLEAPGPLPVAIASPALSPARRTK